MREEEIEGERSEGKVVCMVNINLYLSFSFYGFAFVFPLACRPFLDKHRE